jgi:hypothetical protein
MAIDQTKVAEQIALLLIEAVSDFINALEYLMSLQDWRDNADVSDFGYWDSGNANGADELFGDQSINDNLKHVDGAMINKTLGAILGPDASVTDGVRHHLESTTVTSGPYNGKTYWEVIQMVRRNKNG